MSGQQGRPPGQPGGQQPGYGLPAHYPGQRPATAYLPVAGQPAQRPQQQQQQQGWPLGYAAHAAAGARPQAVSDGGLAGLLRQPQASRPHPAMGQLGVSGAPQQLPQQHQLLPGYAPHRPAQQPAASQPARGPAPHMQQQAYAGYRPAASGAQVPYAVPGQHQYQAPPGSQPVPGQLQYQARPGAPRAPFLQHTVPVGIPPQYHTSLLGVRPGGQLPPGAQPHFAAPAPALSEEDRRVLPKRSLKRKAVAAAGDQAAELDAGAQAALVAVADDFITGAVSFAAGLARRRKATKLEAGDVALYLERTWQLRVPGFSGGAVRPYRRPALRDRHQARTAAIRKETAAASEAAEKARAEAEAVEAAITGE